MERRSSYSAEYKQAACSNCQSEEAMSKELHESPETIWLQIDPDGVGPAEWYTIDDATWCKDQINDSDVKYARYDKRERLDRELGILRKQHREAHDGQAKMWNALTDISCL